MSENDGMSIIDFLLARIAEDESLARDVLATVTPDEWENPTKWGNFFPADIAFWDAATPNRVLAECAAKRAIILEVAGLVEAIDLLTDALPGDFQQDADAPFRTSILRHLASVYQDHPDYNQEWSNDV